MNARVPLSFLAFCMLLSASCSSREPRYLVSEEKIQEEVTVSVHNSTIHLEPTRSGANVYRIRTDEEASEETPIYLTAIEDCSPRRTSLSGRLRQLFVGIALDSFKIEDAEALGTTRASVGYSSARFEDKNLVLSAVLLLPNDACPVDVVFWSANPSEELVRDKTFIVPVADQLLSHLRRS